MEIVGGTETPDGYVGLAHGQKYSIRLSNHGSRQCDSKIQIDGVEAGLFRIPPHSYCDIERPVHSDGHFTFFELVTPEATAAGIRSTSETGLVQATFFPEVPPPPVLFSSPSSGYSAGGTGLSGNSPQEFSSAPSIKYSSPDEFVTISLRLGGYKAASIRPLRQRSLSNVVPPPLT